MNYKFFAYRCQLQFSQAGFACLIFLINTFGRTVYIIHILVVHNVFVEILHHVDAMRESFRFPEQNLPIYALFIRLVYSSPRASATGSCCATPAKKEFFVPNTCCILLRKYSPVICYMTLSRNIE